MTDKSGTPRTAPYEGVWATQYPSGKTIFEHACDLEKELTKALSDLAECQRQRDELRLEVDKRSSYTEAK